MWAGGLVIEKALKRERHLPRGHELSKRFCRDGDRAEPVLCGNRAWLYLLLRRQKRTARGGYCVCLKTQQPGQFGAGVRTRAQGERKQDTLADAAEMARFRSQNGEPYILRENRDEIEEMVSVIYVKRRPI